MTKKGRQGASDKLGPTRGEVAKRFGRDVSWVRRQEGKVLHPKRVGRAHRFDEAELEVLALRLETERQALEVSVAATSEVYRFFESHSLEPERVSIDGIVEKTGIAAQAVRALHASWAERELDGVPRLLSRKELQAITQREEREERESEREHAELLSQWAREDEEREARRAEKRKKWLAAEEAQRKARARERAKQHARNDREKAESVARLSAPESKSEFSAHLAAIASASSVPELLRLMLKVHKQ